MLNKFKEILKREYYWNVFKRAKEMTQNDPSQIESIFIEIIKDDMEYFRRQIEVSEKKKVKKAITMKLF